MKFGFRCRIYILFETRIAIKKTQYYSKLLLTSSFSHKTRSKRQNLLCSCLILRSSLQIKRAICLDDPTPKGALCRLVGHLQRYVRMQCIKKSSTVRVSVKKGKRDKPVPRIIFRFGKQDRQVKKFLETRRFILNSVKQLKKEAKRKKSFFRKC
jgi:hypothetical protein